MANPSPPSGFARILQLATTWSAGVIGPLLPGCDVDPAAPPGQVAPADAAVALAPKDAAAEAAMTGQELYTKYCTACHNANGDGQGIAARYLNPKARDLRAAAFRIVSTENRVPSVADVEGVLDKGIPGSSMRSYRDLSEASRKKLAAEVFRLREEGMREHVVRLLREQMMEDDPADEDVQQILDVRLKPGRILLVPAISPTSPASIARGREVFLKADCHKCHGENGTGDTDLCLQDDEGIPTRPRDLVYGELKGGTEPASLYRRIFLGLPGTPMAGSSVLTDAQRIDLVHYILSLSAQPKHLSTNYLRALATISRGSMVSNQAAPTRPL